jgi:DNA-binding transcriptional MocR family regulator
MHRGSRAWSLRVTESAPDLLSTEHGALGSFSRHAGGPPGSSEDSGPAGVTAWFQGRAVHPVAPRPGAGGGDATHRQVAASDPVLREIAAAVEDLSARGIAAAISRLVSGGRLDVGVRLPTVRALANRLQVSPTTVSQAWQSLARAGIVGTRGRSGTYVRGGVVIGAPRTVRTYESPGGLPLDLSKGGPDPELVPNLGRILTKVGGARTVATYNRRPVLPSLEEPLREQWPFRPEGMTVVNGVLDGLDRLTTLNVQLGSRVLVENPCFPPLLDLLELAGAETVPIPLDDEGPSVEAVVAAMSLDPTAFYLQPRAQNPFGSSMSAQRAADLATVLRGSKVLIIEDDHANGIATSPLVSLGTHLPSQTVHIRGFSKTYGPDLRLAALGGAGTFIEAVDARRLLGPGWSSHLLQAVLAETLVDRMSLAKVADARDAYAHRRSLLHQLLADRGICSTGSDGINVWVEVPDEQRALVSLAVAGIGASPGSVFEAAPLRSDHLRATIAQVSYQADLVADAFAAAVAAGTREGGVPRGVRSGERNRGPQWRM